MLVERYQCQFQALGGLNDIQIFAESEERAAEVFTRVSAEVRRIETKYSRFNQDSVVSHINTYAGSAPVLVDDETARLLSIADGLYGLSGGLFDITSGALQKVWDFRSPELPTREKITESLTRVGWGKVIWNRPKIMLGLPDMHLDFGGFGKEYAVDRAFEVCREMGVSSGLINFGGDLRIVGPRPNGAPWRVGICHPRKQRETIKYCELTSGALATSGDYERFKIVDGNRYCHIINPITGFPVSDFQSVSVFAESCLMSGALSTIAMLKGIQEGKKFLSAIGYSAMLIAQDGSIEFIQKSEWGKNELGFAEKLGFLK